MKNLNRKRWIDYKAEEGKKEKLTMIYLNHTINDTSAFIEKSKEIALNSGVLENEVLKLQIAAWYFDIGCSDLTNNGICNLSDEAGEYLRRLNIDASKLVGFYSDETKQVLNENEKILHDAELSNLSEAKNLSRNLVLKRLVKIKFGYEFSDSEWLELIYKMISEGEFFTKYAEKKYGMAKKMLSEKLLTKIQHLKNAS